MMKGIWRANPLGDALWPPWDKFKSLGIKDIYFPILAKDLTTGHYNFNQREVNPDYRRGVNSQSFGYRLYLDPSWVSLINAKEIVELMRSASVMVGGVAGHQYNIEYHDPKLVADVLKNHRLDFPIGPVSWALEGFQGGWFSQNLVDTINNDSNCVTVPESFYGNMFPNDTPPFIQLRHDLITRGVNPNRVKVFYNGAKPLPDNWDGCILSEETLV
jgi:hypothetical protein